MVLVVVTVVLSACCSETDHDFAIEQEEDTDRSCESICRAYLDHDESDDFSYDLRSCDDGVSEDGRLLAVCHVTAIDCRTNEHF